MSWSSSSLTTGTPLFNRSNSNSSKPSSLANSVKLDLASSANNNVNKAANRLNNMMSRGGNSGGNRNSPSLIYAVTTTANTPSSPTISLLSSSSSSPTSSPTQLAAAANMLTVRSNEKTKANPLSNISSSIAKHQQPQPSLTNGKTNNKLVSVTLDNSGVACSLVKSNTNIYYNLKVDSIASKAIHYCDNCNNEDCKAIHKSLTKPLTDNKMTRQQPQPQQQQQTPLTRIFVSPNLQQHQHIQIQPAAQLLNNSSHHLAAGSSSPGGGGGGGQTSPAGAPNKHQLSGANINFIFERRYPLVQLNTNLFNANNLLNSDSSSSTTRSVSPNSAGAANQRHILISRGTPSSDGGNGDASSSPASSSSNLAFPLPLSPSSLHHAVAAAAALAHAHSQQSGGHNADPNKPTSFSINFNRLPTNKQLQQQPPQQQHAHLQRTKLTDPNELDETLSMFPTVNLNNLRYKNILFLDQVINYSIIGPLILLLWHDYTLIRFKFFLLNSFFCVFSLIKISSRRQAQVVVDHLLSGSWPMRNTQLSITLRLLPTTITTI
jgi:hypothetical protein